MHLEGRPRLAAVVASLTLAAVALLVPAASAGPAKAPAARAATPACFGAAAHDPAHPCSNPAVRFRVTPTPLNAPLQGTSVCPLAATKPPPTRVCIFGAPKKGAQGTLALIGDSHAPAWRAAVDPLAKADGRRGLTVRRSSCPFAFATHVADAESARDCASWVRATLAFVGRHPEITTVFLVNSAAYHWVSAPGKDEQETAVDGYRGVLQALPPSVRHVVVIRDNPVALPSTLDCVDRAHRQGRVAAVRCALPRSAALIPDPLAQAASDLQQASAGTAAADRYRVLDLTPYFCDQATCPPVIGGVLVFKDQSHITRTFSESLGPYFLQVYRALGIPW